MANEFTFTLNGKETVYSGRANARLFDVLREDYQLKGVKCGCKEGECGACSVIIDGRLANSCMLALQPRLSGISGQSALISVTDHPKQTVL